MWWFGKLGFCLAADDGRYQVARPVGWSCSYFRCRLPIEAEDNGFMHTVVGTVVVGENGKIESQNEVVAIHHFCQAFSVGTYRRHATDEPCDCDEVFANHPLSPKRRALETK